ncbi:hypothetical protein LCGC14_3113400, partial [marine sediment metagenome]
MIICLTEKVRKLTKFKCLLRESRKIWKEIRAKLLTLISS